MSARVSNAEAQVWEKLELGYTSLEKRFVLLQTLLLYEIAF